MKLSFLKSLFKSSLDGKPNFGGKLGETQHTLTQNIVEEQNYLYRLIVEQSRDYAVFALDPKGFILTWNTGAERIKGYVPAEIIGKHFSIFYTQDAKDRRWPEHELKIATTTGTFEEEGWRVKKDGSSFWAKVVITALRDDKGKLLGFSKFTSDLSEKKAQEEALRQSEERFRLLIEGVMDYAIYMLDPYGTITSWNNGAQKIKGYSRDEIIGKHLSVFFTQEDIDAGKPWEELARTRHTGRAEVIGWRVKKDGNPFWARSIVSALYDREGNLYGFAKVTQDLTERRQMEALEKAAKNVNAFIATLAHELRNPLAPIRNAVYIMQKNAPEEPISNAMLQTIDRQSAQLSHIVDDMIDISRITRGSLTVDLQPSDITDAMRAAVETIMSKIEESEHTLNVELPQQPIIILGDTHRLTQLLTNLLHNAARYTPKHGYIELKAYAEDKWLILSVTDNGRGIDPVLMYSIFDMFVQGHDTNQKVERGLGVGLALARKIAELHRGTLDAFSEGKNKGATFKLRIPLLEDNKAQTKKNDTFSMAVFNQQEAQKILIVDDNIDAAETLSLALKSQGHITSVIHSGEQTLSLIDDFRPRFVLLDIGLPDIDGYEVAIRIRKIKTSADIKIIAVTGWGQTVDIEKGKTAGFDYHLVKPIDLTQLADILKQKNIFTFNQN